MVSRKHPPSAEIPVADYVAFDLETTGLSPDCDEIMEVAFVRFRSGQVHERWSSLVNPGRVVPLKLSRLTGIKQGDLVDAPKLEDVISAIEAFRGGLPLVGHNSQFDASFLQKRISGFPGCPIHDTLELARIALPGLKSYRLTDLAGVMGIKVSEAHRAYDDAEVSGELFRLLQEKIMDISEKTSRSILAIMGEGWASEKLFTARVRPTQPGLPFAQTMPSTSRQESTLTHDEQTLALQKFFADLLRTPREQDEDEGSKTVAVTVPFHDSTASRAVAACERYSAEEGKAVLLVGFPETAIPVGAIMTGRPEDFLCKARLQEAMTLSQAGEYAELSREVRQFLAGVFHWATLTQTGCFAELQMGVVGYDVVAELSCPASMKCADACPNADSCFYDKRQTRTVAYASMSSALGISDSYDQVLVWGSHDLARAWYFHESCTSLSSLSDTVAALKATEGQDPVPSLPALFSHGRDSLGRGGRAPSHLLTLAVRTAGELDRFSSKLRVLRQGFTEEGAKKIVPPFMWQDLRLLESSAENLAAFGADSEPGVLPLVERDYRAEGSQGVALARRAVWPAMAAAANLEKAARTQLLLLSAVSSHGMASDGGRRYLGFSPSSRRRKAPAVPVDHVLMGFLNDASPAGPKDQGQGMAGFLIRLCSVVSTGVLVLFPSRALLRQSYALVEPSLEKTDIAVYGQGIDGGARIVEHLQEERSVVFALSAMSPRSYDPTPRCLVLTRVPFPPPNPLDDARRAQIASWGGDGFIEANLRPAALGLRMHVERMKTSGAPSAVIAADSRLASGKSVWAGAFMESFQDLTCVKRCGDELVSAVSKHLDPDANGE